ncbi:MAG: hypothetical protein JNJ64_06100, partial [Flavobacteriales bacterium]|nr:hypothetical protein [Flavobacteriales bacterium]
MAQRYAPLPTLLFASISALLSGPLSAQVLVDNFNRANNTTVGGGWTETESSGASSCQISGNELLMGGTTAGRDFVAQNTPGTYNTTLTNNTCTMTWAFNMRQSRTDPSGFAAGNYGVAVVLAGTNSDLTQGNGYAVVLGNSGATDPLRLVRYTGGLDTNANIQNILSASDFGNNYLDVRVTYNPLTDTWGLFYTDNGAAGPFGDPLVAATSAGTTVDATYTGVSTPVIGCLWNHATGGTENARFDNFYVPSACTTTTVQFTGSSASVSETGVSTTLTVSITNPDAINATTADVVLTAGTASRIGNYTTQ